MVMCLNRNPSPLSVASGAATACAGWISSFRTRAYRRAVNSARGISGESAAIALLQPVEPGFEQRVDRRRSRFVRQVSGTDPAAILQPQHVSLDEGRDHLLDDQWVALREVGDARQRIRIQASGFEQVID